MSCAKVIVVFIILAFTAACQPTFVPVVSPTLKPTPFAQPTPRPTQTARSIVGLTSVLPATPLPRATASTSSPTATRVIPTLPSVTPGTPGTPTATLIPSRIPGPNTFTLGTSVEGRDILAWQFGSGEHVLLLVGGIHTGFEANTVLLVNELIAHFESVPADVLPGIRLVLVPLLNPDGLALGRRAEGRFNANRVDLNRNWGCEWSAEAYWKDELVNPGPRAFSEPETLALAQWIRTQRPSAALFYHSAASGVFAGNCNDGHGSDELAAVLGEATGYAYGQPFTAYPVSGTESNWVDGLGIPAVDVELSGTRESEFTRNLNGVMAVQRWLTRAQ